VPYARAREVPGYARDALIARSPPAHRQARATGGILGAGRAARGSSDEQRPRGSRCHRGRDSRFKGWPQSWPQTFYPSCVSPCGARRDRTADLLHAMQALSQLSYGPTERPAKVRKPRRAVKKKRIFGPDLPESPVGRHDRVPFGGAYPMGSAGRASSPWPEGRPRSPPCPSTLCPIAKDARCLYLRTSLHRDICADREQPRNLSLRANPPRGGDAKPPV
jgi:hypothetical protein